MTYSNGESIKVGDVITDGIKDELSEYRLKNKAKVLYVDENSLVWFPLNDFTCHGGKYNSKTYSLSALLEKKDISDLSEKELKLYHEI